MEAKVNSTGREAKITKAPHRLPGDVGGVLGGRTQRRRVQGSRLGATAGGGPVLGEAEPSLTGSACLIWGVLC